MSKELFDRTMPDVLEHVADSMETGEETGIHPAYIRQITRAIRYHADLIAQRDALLVALERIGDPRMWRDENGETVWRGETADHNEIETEDPREIARTAIAMTEGER